MSDIASAIIPGRKEGETLFFALAACSVGHVLVAQSAQGICAILLGEDPARLPDDLQHSFPRARLTPDNTSLNKVISQVVAFIDQPETELSLPLDLRGTPFQQRVWQALRHIPVGMTVSYTDLAQRIGSPKAVRAVAGACAANVLAVAIPCHRVVRSDGTLSGYRWGIERKRQLLNREAQARSAG